MRKAHTAAVLLFLLGASADARASECGLKLVASYDMLGDKGDYSTVVIPLTIAGKSRPTMIDTGAFSGWVTDSFVSELGLERKSIRGDALVYGVAHRIMEYASVPSIDIGVVHQKPIDFTIMPDTAKAELAAALGHNALSRFDVEFDFAARKVKFFSQDHCEGQVVYWTKAYTVVPFKSGEDKIELTMTLDGRDIDAVLDTGSTYTHINRRVLMGVYGMDDNSPNVKQVTLAGGYKVETATFRSLSIGGATFPNPSLLVQTDTRLAMARFDIPDKEQNQPGVVMPHLPHLLLGLDALSQLHVYIAYGERKIYLTSAGAH